MPRPVVTRRRLAGLLLALPVAVGAQSQDTAPAKTRDWYENFRIRGYGQVRYNRLFETNDLFACEQCDRSIGAGGGFFIRRARIILQGQIHPRVFMYLQPDYASSVSGAQHVAQLRDWYLDVGLDADNAFRLRLGQSKVPYSFENMQSSQNRLPLDRADATNSAASNERDLGAFFYWAPTAVRARFNRLVASGLKGSGDYGVLAVGAYNGQTANRAEANDNLHVVARLTYPFVVGRQIIEPSVAAYTGRYVVTPDQRTAGVKGTADWNYRDERALVGVSLYPQPFGILAEYNVGRGPEYNPATDSIETQSLAGGFVTATWQLQAGAHTLFPFLRWQAYDGGKKHERDARRHAVRDLEAGVEWQPYPAFEVVAAWHRGTRRFEDRQRPVNRQRGDLLRLQAQFNF